MQRILIILLAALVLSPRAAAAGALPRRKTAVSASRPRVFLPAIAPAGLSPDEQRDYLRRHYWDRFDFTDTLFVSEADTVQMIEAFARYIAVLSDRPADSAPMDSLMRRVSSSKPMLDYFAMLAGTVLHDPNSPLRNDEFYIPVLRRSSPALSTTSTTPSPRSTTSNGHANRLGRLPTISATRSPRAPRGRSTGCKPNTCCCSSTIPAVRCAVKSARRSPPRRCFRR